MSNEKRQKHGGGSQSHGTTGGHGMKSEVHEEQQLRFAIFQEEVPTDQEKAGNLKETAVYGTVRTVV